MMETPHLGLPFLAAQQSQKHVTMNEALDRLDLYVQLTVATRQTSTPPPAPVPGYTVIVPTSGNGAFAGHGDKLARYDGFAWQTVSPPAGCRAWVLDEGQELVWTGTNWDASLGSELPRLGINATADAQNRFVVASPATLFQNEGGSHRVKINRAATTDTSSVVFQTAYSGRVEMGLAGSQDFRLKTSADGAVWRDAMIAEAATGRIYCPQTPAANSLLYNGDFRINQRGFAGGSLAANAYGHDRWQAAAGGATYTVSGDGTISLASGAIQQVIEAPRLAGRILCVSVENLSGGTLGLEVAGTSNSIAPGVTRTGASFAIPAGATGNVTVKLVAPVGGCSFQRVKAEEGTIATAWHAVHLTDELLRCQRYYETGATYVYGWPNGSPGAPRLPVTFKASKRIAPAVGFSGITYFASSQITAQANATGGFSIGFLTDGSGSAAGVNASWAAEAEL